MTEAKFQHSYPANEYLALKTQLEQVQNELKWTKESTEHIDKLELEFKVKQLSHELECTSISRMDINDALHKANYTIALMQKDNKLDGKEKEYLTTIKQANEKIIILKNIIRKYFAILGTFKTLTTQLNNVLKLDSNIDTFSFEEDAKCIITTSNSYMKHLEGKLEQIDEKYQELNTIFVNHDKGYASIETKACMLQLDNIAEITNEEYSGIKLGNLGSCYLKCDICRYYRPFITKGKYYNYCEKCHDDLKKEITYNESIGYFKNKE